MRKIFLLAGIISFLISTVPMEAQLQVSPASMVFPEPQPVGSPIPGILPVVITNTGSQSVDLIQATLTGDFTFASATPTQTNPLAPLMPGGLLTFSVLFNATAAGPRTGTLTISVKGANTLVFQLSGTGFVGALVQPRSSKLDFVTPSVGSTVTQTEEIVSVGNQPTTVTDVSISGNGFSQTNNCGATLSQGQTCQISVTYNSPALGLQTGTLTVTNSGVTSPLNIALTGDAGDFSLIIDPPQSSATVTAGQQANFPFLISGFLGAQGISAITFSCNGLPPGATCAVMSGGLNPPANTFSAVLIVSTTARNSASLRRNLPWLGWSAVAVVGLAFILPRRRRMTFVAMMVLGFMLTLTVVSCGGSSGSSNPSTFTPAGTYNVTLIGTRNGLTHSFPVTLIVH